jgi:glutaredoxin
MFDRQAIETKSTTTPAAAMSTQQQNEKGGTLMVYVTYLTAIRKVKADCERLLQILDSRNILYTKVDVGVLPFAREQMIKQSGKTELPQVFVDKDFVGVCSYSHLLIQPIAIDTQ